MPKHCFHLNLTLGLYDRWPLILRPTGTGGLEPLSPWHLRLVQYALEKLGRDPSPMDRDILGPNCFFVPEEGWDLESEIEALRMMLGLDVPLPLRSEEEKQEESR